MKTSCISHPEKESLLLIRAWQLQFCDGNACAAALLSFYEYWHGIKQEMTSKNKKANDIAQTHGDERSQDETLLQFHSYNELIEGILGVYGKGAVIAANRLLEEKRAISIHRNPNPRYSFDKTNYYLFHPEVCSAWLVFYKKKRANNDQNSGNRSIKNHPNQETIEDRNRTLDSPVSDYRSAEIGQRLSENELAITETTNKDFKQIDKKGADEIFSETVSLSHSPCFADMQSFFHIQVGISLEKLNKPDSQQAIASMLGQGITTVHLEKALRKAVQCKPDETFGLYYIKKISESLFTKEQAESAKKKVSVKSVESLKTRATYVLTEEQIDRKKQIYIENNKKFTALSREMTCCKSPKERADIFDAQNKISMLLGGLISEFKQLKIQI